MSSIHSIEDTLLKHIVYLYYQQDVPLRPLLLTCKKWCRIGKQIHYCYNLFYHTEKFNHARWNYTHIKGDRTYWSGALEYHRWKAKDEVFQLTFEKLFGGHFAFKNIPYTEATCRDLMHANLPEKELTAPIMRGHDRTGRDFISIRFPVAVSDTIMHVHYLFIRSPYWRVHHCCGDRALLGKIGAAMACLISAHKFNKAAFPECRTAIRSIMRGDRIIPRHLV